MTNPLNKILIAGTIALLSVPALAQPATPGQLNQPGTTGVATGNPNAVAPTQNPNIRSNQTTPRHKAPRKGGTPASGPGGRAAGQDTQGSS